MTAIATDSSPPRLTNLDLEEYGHLATILLERGLLQKLLGTLPWGRLALTLTLAGRLELECLPAQTKYMTN